MPETLAQSWIMLRRSYRLSMRNVDGLLTGILLPVILMLVFVVLFGGAIATGTEYVTYVVPGVILLSAAFGAATTSVSVSADVKGGMMERFRSMPIAPWSVLAGHVGASWLRNLLATAIVVGVAVAIGFRPTAGVLEWLVVGGLVSLFILAVSWLAATVGVLASSPEAASAFSFFAMFLPYVSSGFVPVETLPGWLQGFARHQPVTPLIEAVRALLTGLPLGDALLVSATWWAALTLACFALAAWTFARRTG
jgi:ABC-2 type transport system permease protein